MEKGIGIWLGVAVFMMVAATTLTLVVMCSDPAFAGQPPVVPLDETPPTVGDVDSSETPGIVGMVFQAIKDKDWAMLTSGLIMLLVFLGNWLGLSRLTDKQRKKWMPWIAVGVGFVLQFAAALALGGGWLDALNTAFVTGAGAGGLWSMLGKQILSQFSPPPPAPKLVQ